MYIKFILKYTGIRFFNIVLDFIVNFKIISLTVIFNNSLEYIKVTIVISTINN